MFVDEISMGFDGAWLCKAVARLSGCPATGLHLFADIRNSTDAIRSWYYNSSNGTTLNPANLYSEFIEIYFRNSSKKRSSDVVILSRTHVDRMPVPLELVVINPLFIENKQIGWLSLGCDLSSASRRSQTNLIRLAKDVSDFIISFLSHLSVPVASSSDEIESSILKAFLSSDDHAFAVFTSNGKKVMSSNRWSHIFGEDNTPLSSGSILRKWGQEWQCVLDGETVKGHWVSTDNKGNDLNLTILPWYVGAGEINGVIVSCEVAGEKTARLHEQKSHLLGKFILIENERKRLARRLHDDLGQSLSAALMNLELVDRSGDSHEQDAALQKTRSLLNQTISEIRAISQQLRPSIIDDFGLTTALKALCNKLSKTSDKKINFYAFKVDSDIPEFYQISVFRICQEALEYILNFTNAPIINVQLFQRENSVLLHIHDEESADKSIKWSLPDKSGIEEYLNEIKEQAALHNGDFYMDLQTENGTDLIIQFPLNEYSKELQDKSYE